MSESESIEDALALVAVEPERRPFEQWAEAKKTPAWKLAAAKAHENWPLGREVTEAAFDQAVRAACDVALR